MTFIPSESITEWRAGESHIFNVSKIDEEQYAVAYQIEGKPYLEIANHAEFLVAFQNIEKQAYSYMFTLNEDNTLTVDTTKKYVSVTGYEESE